MESEKTIPQLRQEIESLKREIAELRNRHLDITDLVRDFRNSESLLRQIFDSSMEGIFLLDLQANVVAANHTILKKMALEADQLTGQPLAKFFPPKINARRKKIFDKILRNQKPIIYTDEGLYGDYDTLATPIFDDKQNLRFVAVYLRDITDRKQAEEKLRCSEQRYLDLLQSQHELIARSDAQKKLTFVNEAYCRMFGKKKEELLGRSFLPLIHEDDLPHTLATLEKLITPPHHVVFAQRVMSVNGWRWIEWDGTAFFDSQNNLIEIQGVGRDITEQRELEDELNAYHQEMIRAERLASLGTMSATMAHQLNQPLTVIRLLMQDTIAQIREYKIECPEIIENLTDSLSEIENAISLITRYGAITRSSTGQSLENLSLNHVAQRITAALTENARRARMELVINNLDNLPQLKIDNADIEQILFIIIQNAIQAADGNEPHKLVISGKHNQKEIELTFEDDCGGMSPETQLKAFTSFFTTKPIGQGTGLGLTILERIVFKYAGEVWFDSVQGKGTTFHVTLPKSS